jgi:hypothetical protein
MNRYLKEIIKQYSALWKIKERGETIEIITPMVTTTDMFISVFITVRGDEFVVTDGGQMLSEVYDVDFSSDAQTHERMINFFSEQFEICCVKQNKKTFYYKKVCKIEKIPQAVFDLSNFIASTINSIDIPLKEERVDKQFRIKAKNYLDEHFHYLNISFDKTVDDDINIKFNAITNNRGKFQLVNFITGSSSAYYTSSLCKSNMGFYMVAQSGISTNIDRMISLMDDSKYDIINSPQVVPFKSFKLPQGMISIISLPWSQKSKLDYLLGA